MELTPRPAPRPPSGTDPLPAPLSPDRTLQCTIQGGDLAPGAARRILEQFAPDLAERRRDDARLLISELVTNSVRHADAGDDQAVELTFSCSDSVLHVTVGDHGRGFDPVSAKKPRHGAREGGRGLFLVDAVADRWGVTTGRMTRVWFELAV